MSFDKCSRCGKEVIVESCDKVHYYFFCDHCSEQVTVLIDMYVSGEVQVIRKWTVEYKYDQVSRD